MISGQRIPWSFVQRLLNQVGRDWTRVIDMFWRARCAASITGWISKGLRPNADGKRYALYPSTERNNGEFDRVVMRWWREQTEAHKKRKQPTSTSKAMGQFFKDMADLYNG